MCDAYNNYYNIIAYTFATYTAKGCIPFDQNSFVSHLLVPSSFSCVSVIYYIVSLFSVIS